MNIELVDTSRPMIFRPEQIENFITSMTVAATFEGPDGTTYHDDYINLVLDEVTASEADLSDARVAIERYVVSNLAKEPDNVMFMRLHDSIQPIIKAVIDIEIKMHGKPKYIVSKANTNATAWRLDGVTDSPIHNINLPPDVAEEIKKYSFLTVTEEVAFPTLPNKEQDINDYRRSFFSALEVGDQKSEDVEKKWLENFEKEAVFDFLDKVIYASNFHDQISLTFTNQVETYCLFGDFFGSANGRDEKALAYEQECNIIEPELSPDEFITTARDASLRALFTVLLLTEPNNNSLVDVICDHHQSVDKEWTRDHMDLDVTDERIKCVKSLIKLYGKHPIFTEDFESLKFVFQACDQALRNHFYVAMNDFASYYGERNFHKSALNCYLLKEYLANMEGVEVKSKVASESSETTTVAPTDTSSGVYIED
jgi:hypothetical protein